MPAQPHGSPSALLPTHTSHPFYLVARHPLQDNRRLAAELADARAQVTALEVFNSQNGGDAKRVGDAIEASRATLTKVPNQPLSDTVCAVLCRSRVPLSSSWCAWSRPRHSWRR